MKKSYKLQESFEFDNIDKKKKSINIRDVIDIKDYINKLIDKNGYDVIETTLRAYLAYCPNYTYIDKKGYTEKFENQYVWNNFDIDDDEYEDPIKVTLSGIRLDENEDLWFLDEDGDDIIESPSVSACNLKSSVYTIYNDDDTIAVEIYADYLLNATKYFLFKLVKKYGIAVLIEDLLNENKNIKDMNKNQKKALYESIMKQVAKTVKNALNEVRVSDNLLTEDEEYTDEIEQWAESVGLYDELRKALSGWTWDDWCSAGNIDKEDVLADALMNIDDDTYTDEDLYDLFYEWVGGLEESDFEDDNSEESDDSETLEFDEEFYTKTELEDGTIIISDLTEDIHDIVVKMYEADADSFGHYSMELIDENEIDCYDWDEYEHELINKAEEEGGDVYTIKNDIGDFEQPIGLAIII